MLTSKDLKDWKRVSIPPNTPLKEKNPWSVAADGMTLICDGVGIHEMLLFNQEFGDGIFHVEWKFKKTMDGAKYNSGVFVRTSADGAIWHQAQVGSKNVGYLFGADYLRRRDEEVSHRRQGPAARQGGRRVEHL